MDKKEIIEVLSALHKITGFRVSLHGANYEEIAAFPEEKCKFCQFVQKNESELQACIDCDRQACETALKKQDTHIYKCRYGLTEAISPLYNFGHLTGFLFMGQTITSRADIALPQSEASPDIEEAISKIPVTQKELIPSYVKIMTVSARYLTLSNAVIPRRPTIAENAKSYIHDNYKRKIGIKDICDHLSCSKTTLVKLFKAEFGTTVNSYITDVRLAEAEILLKCGSVSVNEVARDTGFCDQSYFSKVFLARYGVTPKDFRNQKNRE